jgi:hypothetical protein
MCICAHIHTYMYIRTRTSEHEYVHRAAARCGASFQAGVTHVHVRVDPCLRSSLLGCLTASTSFASASAAGMPRAHAQRGTRHAHQKRDNVLGHLADHHEQGAELLADAENLQDEEVGEEEGDALDLRVHVYICVCMCMSIWCSKLHVCVHAHACTHTNRYIHAERSAHSHSVVLFVTRICAERQEHVYVCMYVCKLRYAYVAFDVWTRTQHECGRKMCSDARA